MEVADTLYSSDSDPEFGEAMLRLGVGEGGAKARTPLSSPRRRKYSSPRRAGPGPLLSPAHSKAEEAAGSFEDGKETPSLEVL